MQVMEAKTSLQQLCEIGQSVWLDNISRALLLGGALKQFISQGVMGVTSNPTIFDQAISKSNDYDAVIGQLCSKKLSTFEIYDELTVSDIRSATDIFRPIYESTRGADGYVSLEVNPLLARDTQKTIQEAGRLYKKVNRPNLMLKIPATDEGFEAVAALLSQGMNVNVTLIFSQRQYAQTMSAFLEGAQAFAKSGGRLERLASVASVFISRLDSTVDTLLDEKIKKGHDPRQIELLTGLKGKAAVANAQLIFRQYYDFFMQGEFLELEKKGLRRQRLLWASTSTKNPAYSDIKYVAELIAPQTINTMPQATINAFLDHGVASSGMTTDIKMAKEVVGLLLAQGVDIHQICEKLLVDGVAAFEKSFNSLLETINNKTKKACQ